MNETEMKTLDQLHKRLDEIPRRIEAKLDSAFARIEAAISEKLDMLHNEIRGAIQG